MSHFYSTPYRDVLKLPIKTFWSLIRNSYRLKAASDMRLLHLLAAAQAGTGIQETSETLRTEQGTPIVAIDSSRDENANQSLREAFGQ